MISKCSEPQNTATHAYIGDEVKVLQNFLIIVRTIDSRDVGHGPEEVFVDKGPDRY